MAWQDECKGGSNFTTIVELEFQHVMADRNAPGAPEKWAPFPSHAVHVPCDSRSGFLVWLHDGSPAHARWCNETQEFLRIGDDKVLDKALLRAWAPIPFPVAPL